MSRLDQIKALADKVDGELMILHNNRVCLELTRMERNLIADALTVLYGVEHRAELDAVAKELFDAQTAALTQDK